MYSFKRSLLLVIIIVSVNNAYGQQVPYSPVSFRIFNPFVFNPAVTGNKDFSTIDISAGWLGESSSQNISFNTRLLKTGPSYFTSREFKEFSNLGVGGYFFNEKTETYRNIGASGAFSYQVPLKPDKLSFLSFGIAVKGIFNEADTASSPDPPANGSSKSTFYPNIDAGIYYYGTNLYAGFSTTNILGNPEKPDSTGFYAVPVSRQYYFQVGYKILIYRPLNLVVEPSVILNADDTLSGKMSDMIKPMLKIYIEDFCFGTYFNDFSKISFFFQYRYPRFYLATYFEIPNNSPYYKKPLNVEFSVGINFPQAKAGYSRKNHW